LANAQIQNKDFGNMNQCKMPIRAAPYKHQQEAFKFACHLFGLDGGDDDYDNKLCNLRQSDMEEAESAEKNN